MRRIVIVAALAAGLLSGCALFDKGTPRGGDGLQGYDPKVVRRPDPVLPNVFVTDDKYIVVDQEPVLITKRQVVGGRVEIAWALEAGSAFTFPENGIRLLPFGNGPAPVDLKCRVLGSARKVFTCSYTFPGPKVTYKYEVTVLDNGRPLQKLDPTVVNDN